VSERLHPAFSVTELDHEGHHTLLLTGELDLASVPILEAATLRACTHRSGLTVDLRNLTFLDASGIRAIIYANELYKHLGYAFSLVPGPRSIQRLFTLTGLTDTLTFIEGSGRDTAP